MLKNMLKYPDICKFSNNEAILYTHKECFLDPEWSAPPSVDLTLVHQKDTSPETHCDVCHRLLSEDPPYQWSTMSDFDVHHVIGQRQTDKRKDDKIPATN